MIRGIYTAASGMLAESIRNDAIANNLANVDTAGYKRDAAINKDFANVLIRRINDGPVAPEIGSLGEGTVIDKIATIYSDGAQKITGNELDLAIAGNGFFTVETAAGIRYTRKGSFTRNARGELVTHEGERVLGTNGQPIVLSGANNTAGAGVKVAISSRGAISVDGVAVGQLQLVQFDNPQQQLDKEGASLFRAPDGINGQPATGTVTQGVLEMSNANVVTEMINMISGQRAYEANAKVVQSHDELTDKAVNDVGRIS